VNAADAVAQRRTLSQPQRVLSAVIYVAGFLLLANYLNGQLLPAFGLSGLWFYSAFAALVLGQFLIEPFFTRPADAIANAIAVLIAVTSVDTSSAHVAQSEAIAWRYGFIAYALVVLVLAVGAVVVKDRGGRIGAAGPAAFQAAGVLGRSTVIFSLLLFASGYVAFADSSGKVAALYLSWIVVFVLHPIEFAIRYARLWGPSARPGQLVVDEIRDPGLLRARVAAGTGVQVGATVRLRGGDEAIGTIVDATSAFREAWVWITTTHARDLRNGSELEIADLKADPNVIGRVVDHTDLATAVIQAGPGVSTTHAEEGSLIQLPIRGDQAMYQVVDVQLVIANETNVAREVYQVSARKLGRWDEAGDQFVPVPWLPAPNATAELVHPTQSSFNSKYIGFVPGTSFGIAINIDAAITHNTAIIGILGVGKTHLGWELIGRAVADGVKVVALDITGKYTPRFGNIVALNRSEEQIAGRIEPQIAADFGNDKVRNNEAGNVAQFRTLIAQELADFINGPERMMVLNPNGFNVSRMEGNPFNAKANRLSRMSMVEVTQYVAEEVLRLAQNLPQLDPHPGVDDDRARICLVLEEAHSLIPEWNSVTSPADQLSTNSTAKAILQGRKYGFGCLLITQRTANVTKSILNQCNTVFAMRIYDATGMGFLENYIGAGYAKLLATLRPRHAVIFGRGSSCDAPLIVELNDKDEFQQYWAGEVPKLNAAMVPAQEPAAPVAAPPAEPAQPLPPDADVDDIPF
jgi:Helicase HerA, central domain